MKRMLNEDLIYEILAVVEEIPEGYVASYGQIARLIGRDLYGRILRRLSLPSGRQCGRADCAGLAGTAQFAGGRRCDVSRKRLRRHEAVSVAVLREHIFPRSEVAEISCGAETTGGKIKEKAARMKF